MADWSLLPKDILELIVGRFETSFQIVAFRSVCRSWWSGVPSPRNSRCLGIITHIPMLPGSTRDDQYCALKKIPVFILRFKTPFGDDYLLASMRERKSGKPMSMCSPLSNHCITPPGRHTMLFNSLTCQIVPLGHYYQINMDIIITLDLRDEIKWGSIFKRVEFIQVDTEDCRGFTLLASTYQEILVMFKSSDMSWARISLSHESIQESQDMVAFKGRFYVVDTSGWGHVFVIEPSSEVSEIPSVTGSTDEMSSRECLVQSEEELFLVQQFIPGEYPEEDMYTWFRVFRLDEKEGMRKWVQVNDLNDQVIFLGPWSNLCCSVQKLPGAKENCIVFIDSTDMFISENDSIFVFDLRTGRTSCTALSECRGYMGAFSANLESLVSCGVVTMPNPATSIHDLLSEYNSTDL